MGLSAEAEFWSKICISLNTMVQLD